MKSLVFLILISSLQVFSKPVDIYFSEGGVITKYVDVTEPPALPPALKTEDQVEEVPAESADDKIEGTSDSGEPEGGSQPFDYNFVVKNKDTKLFIEKSEKREGSQVTGSYSVLLPNGLTQVVEYVADKENGFVPKIFYIENSPFE